MSDVYEVTVHDASVSEKNAYIYLIYSREFNVVYVGETYNRKGALARLSQHLSNHGKGKQFRDKVEDFINHDFVSFNKIHFAAFPLVGKENYENKSYREAVELNTFKNILNKIDNSEIHPVVISRHTSSSHSDLPFIQDQSLRVTNLLFDWLLDKARP